MSCRLAAIRVKAKFDYTCQECGSTELIQAHHQIRGDDSSLISLCAEHHSQKHPDVPKALFFNKNHQPYWHNISASSIAHQIGVHPRTIIRRARKFLIGKGSLSHTDKEKIINAYNINRQIYQPVNYHIYIHVCKRCGYEWASRDQHPLRCAKCKTPYWDKERKNVIKD